MRLRSRPRPPLGDGWVLPRRSGHGTAIGNLDAPEGAVVDPAGLVALDGAGWSLDWWVGAEDRWHVPAREVAVRQELVGGSPVVETRLRIPGGDAVHRAYAARGPTGEDVVVVEVRNDTAVPFALALSLRPFGVDGEGRLGSVALAGTTVTVDGRASVTLSRPPGRAAFGTRASGDPASVVFGGTAEPAAPSSVECPDGGASAALLFPVAHTATLRVVIGPDGASVPPGSVPGPDRVASGWSALARRGARAEVPDRRLRDALAACTRSLLLGPVDATGAIALDGLGFAPEAAAALLDGLSPEGEPPGLVLHGLGRHWALTRDEAFAARAVGLVAASVSGLGRTADADAALGRSSLREVAGLLDAAGEPAAAVDALRLAGPVPAPGARPQAVLEERLATASPTWTWPGCLARDRAGAVAVASALRAVLVDDRGPDLALTPHLPDAWLGQGWQVHDLPTSWGWLSYAIRWHGDRPALLWELEPHPGAEPVRLTVPSLDPGWSATGLSGEALLAPVAVPERPPVRRGLRLPVTIEPTPRRSR